MQVNKGIMPLAQHFQELRKVLMVSGLFILAGSIMVYLLWADLLFLFLTQAVQSLEVPIIATRVTELLMAKIKISLLGGFTLAFPVILWQLWSFFRSALNKRERRWAYIFIPTSILLFGLGITFTYLTIFPLTVKFLLFTVSNQYMPMITMKEYLSFTLAFFVPMGLAFQLPLAILVLGKLHIIQVELLVQIRKYAVFLIVLLSAVLTGPDIVSQLMMAGPVYVLYEISILTLKISQFLAYRKAKRTQPEMSA